MFTLPSSQHWHHRSCIQLGPWQDRSPAASSGHVANANTLETLRGGAVGLLLLEVKAEVFVSSAVFLIKSVVPDCFYIHPVRLLWAVCGLIDWFLTDLAKFLSSNSFQEADCPQRAERVWKEDRMTAAPNGIQSALPIKSMRAHIRNIRYSWTAPENGNRFIPSLAHHRHHAPPLRRSWIIVNCKVNNWQLFFTILWPNLIWNCGRSASSSFHPAVLLH